MGYNVVDTYEMESMWQNKNLQSVREVIVMSYNT